jgi:hypothetical protein
MDPFFAEQVIEFHFIILTLFRAQDSLISQSTLCCFHLLPIIASQIKRTSLLINISHVIHSLQPYFSVSYIYKTSYNVIALLKSSWLYFWVLFCRKKNWKIQPTLKSANKTCFKRSCLTGGRKILWMNGFYFLGFDCWSPRFKFTFH